MVLQIKLVLENPATNKHSVSGRSHRWNVIEMVLNDKYGIKCLLLVLHTVTNIIEDNIYATICLSW